MTYIPILNDHFELLSYPRLIDSFYFELIILSPWGKTLQQFKVTIDRSVITNIIQKNQYHHH